jgi:hypothetical protein
MAAAMKVTAFGHVMPCGFIDRYHYFSSTCYFHLQVEARSNSSEPSAAMQHNVLTYFSCRFSRPILYAFLASAACYRYGFSLS